MYAARNALLETHPDYKLRSLDSVYNCMGMVFASRRTWIEPDNFGMIVQDDGYVERKKKVNALPGDVVVYRISSKGEVIHAGIVIAVDPDIEEGNVHLTVLSQFGADGEYIHQAEDLPKALGLQKPDIAIFTDAKDGGER